jgi:CubicO group peptidase (beta-lactamase class C family)
MRAALLILSLLPAVLVAQLTTAALFILSLLPAPLPAQATPWSAAAEYSRRHNGDALLVMRGDSIVFETYDSGYRATVPHMLASGSKSFVCALAVAAVSDGLLSLDEPVARTITEWQADAQRSQVTVRQLLHLTSGLAPGVTGFEGGPLGRTRRADAVSLPMQASPGTVFRYGPSHFDVFGELMRRKLNGEPPDAYLQRKVLDPIGMTGLHWRRDRENMPMLPGGAFTTAREWAKYGRLIRDEGRWGAARVLDAELLRECTTPGAVNASYGLTFWLSTSAAADLAAGQAQTLRARRAAASPAHDVIMAAGAGGQRLYVLRELDLVVVRLGRQDPRWLDSEFVRLLKEAAG